MQLPRDLRRHVLEPQTHLRPTAFPCELRFDVEGCGGPGQGKFQLPSSMRLAAPRQAERPPALAQIGRIDLEPDARFLAPHFHRNLYWDPRVAPPLFLHQRPSRSETRFCALHRQRLIQDEMSSKVEGRAQPRTV